MVDSKFTTLTAGLEPRFKLGKCFGLLWRSQKSTKLHEALDNVYLNRLNIINASNLLKGLQLIIAILIPLGELRPNWRSGSCSAIRGVRAAVCLCLIADCLLVPVDTTCSAEHLASHSQLFRASANTNRVRSAPSLSEHDLGRSSVGYINLCRSPRRQSGVSRLPTLQPCVVQ